MKYKGFLLVWVISFLLGGCAQHARIDAFNKPKIQHESWQGQCFIVELLYAQPKPGILSGGQALPLRPFNEAEKSSEAVTVLKTLPDIIKQQLPVGVTWGNHCVYQLHVAVKAFDKRGPSYAVFSSIKNYAKSLVTLGFDFDKDYEITANFTVEYRLQKQNDGTPIFSQRFEVNRKLSHEHGNFEFSEAPLDYARQLFQQQIARTLNEFFRRAAKETWI